jgi:hypothetical protein
MLCCLPALLLPLAGRSAFELHEEEAVLAQRFEKDEAHAPKAVAVLSVARDPFVPDAPQQIAPSGTPSSLTSGSVVGTHVVQGAPIGIALPSGAEVRAIVSGLSPRALVEEGGRVRVVAPGDSLNGSRILRIDSSGVALQNGLRLSLSEHPK